jgi:predicted dehydrogenase
MAHENSPVGIGIIGCGVIAQFHARALREYAPARLVAIADVRDEVAQRMGHEFEVAIIYADAHSLLNDDAVDGVVLALPTHARTELALAAYAAGKHVLTEKPVAMNAAEVRSLIDAKGHLVGACCSSRYRFTATAEAATAFLRSGRLGALRHIHCRVVGPAGAPSANLPPAWRLSRALNGGGILVNWGCYDLDFLLGILDWSIQPRRASGQVYTYPPQFAARLPENSDAETHAIGLIHCDDDVTLFYERAEMYPGPPEASWDIVGTGGTLKLSMTPTDGPQATFYAAPAEGGVQAEVICEDAGDHGDTHNGPVRNFAASIRGIETPRTSLEQALLVAQITDGIYQSAYTGSPVEFS